MNWRVESGVLDEGDSAEALQDSFENHFRDMFLNVPHIKYITCMHSFKAALIAFLVTSWLNLGLDNNSISICIAIFFFNNGDMIFKTFPIYITSVSIHWFICGVWLRWINMSTTRFKIKTWHGCCIWMHLWRKLTVFRKVLMAFSFYLINLLSWAEQLRLQPLPGKPLVLPLSQRLLLAENQIARHDISFHYMSTHVAEWQ